MIGESFWKMSDPVLIVGDEGRLVELNPSARDTFGVAEGDDAAIGSILGDASKTFAELLRSNSEGLLDLPEVGLTYRVTPFPVDGGHTAVIFRDVTAEQRHLEGLRRLNSIAREVLTVDTVDVVLQSIVDEAKELTGASFSGLLLLKEGSTTEVARFVYNAPRHLFPSRLPRVVGLLAVPIESGAPARVDDIRGHPAGVGIPVEHPPIGPLLAVPIVAEDVVLGELAVANQPDEPVFTDVDEAVLEELGLHAVQAISLARAREVALESDQARQAMMDLLRHDMMTPIATAKGAVDLLRNQFKKLSEEQREQLLVALGRAVENVERMAKNLRSDARLEAPKLDREFSAIEVGDLLEDLGQDLTDRASKKQVKIEVRAEEDAPATFGGAYLLVRQALENLLTNAIKFSPSGSVVTLTARAEGGSVRFDVQDQGPGISAEDQAQLFLRYKRGRRKTDPPQAGIGLGLSIVKKVAEAHGGAVGVASNLGEGATFWISFPVSAVGAEIPAQ